MKLFAPLLSSAILAALFTSADSRFTKVGASENTNIPPPVKPAEPRSFGAESSGNASADHTLRLTLDPTRAVHLNTLVPVEDCDVTFSLDHGEGALIYSRSDMFGYTCKQVFQPVDPSGYLTLTCQHFRLRFNCFFESLLVQVDDQTFTYCLDDLIPEHQGQVISVTYDRQYLGFNGGFVCSVVANSPPTLSESLSLCQTCGVPVTIATKSDSQVQDQRIVGGVNAQQGANPWMVLLRIMPQDGSEYRCGGNLVTDALIVSAAHCFYGYGVKHVDAVLGLYDTRDLTGTITIRSTDFTVHPSYDDWYIHNDIAVVKLPQPVTFSDTVRPICLPSSDLDLDEVTVKATGWGTFSFYGNTAQVLQEVDLEITTNEFCQDVWNRYASDIVSTQLCALGDGKDTCLGDSGGPLVFQVGEAQTLVAITSYGYECAKPGIPGVYTRVSKFVTWIESYIDEGYCQDDPSAGA